MNVQYTCTSCVISFKISWRHRFQADMYMLPMYYAVIIVKFKQKLYIPKNLGRQSEKKKQKQLRNRQNCEWQYL